MPRHHLRPRWTRSPDRPRRLGRSLVVAGAVVALAVAVLPAAAAAAAAQPTATPTGQNEIRALLDSMPTAFRQTNSLARSLEAGLATQTSGTVTPRAPRPPGMTVAEYNLPQGITPIDIKNGPDGGVWFSGPHSLGRIDPVSKQIDIFPSPINAGVPYSLNGGPGPYMYFTSISQSNGIVGNDIGRINVFTHQYELFNLPTPQAYPADLKTGSDANIWFSEAQAGKVGLFNTRNNSIQEFTVGPDSLPQGVATGEGSCLTFRQCAADGSSGINTPGGPLANGKVYVALEGNSTARTSKLPPGNQNVPSSVQSPPTATPGPGGNSLLVIDPANPNTNTRIPFQSSASGTLDDDPGVSNQEVFWAEQSVDKIGFLANLAQGYPYEVQLPTPGASPFCIGAGPKAKGSLMFFTEPNANAIGVFDRRSGYKIYELPVISPSSGLTELTQNSRSNSVYFTEADGNKIGEVIIR